MPTYNAIGYESLAISTTAVGLTKPTGAKAFVGTLETAAVRVRSDGTDPTASEGQLILVADSVILSDSEIDTAAFIRDGASDGVLKGHYYSIEASTFF